MPKVVEQPTKNNILLNLPKRPPVNQAAKDPIRDPSLKYLRHLFLGHALVALGAQDQGMIAFELARSEIPAAQSARVAAMNLALVRGERDLAERLAEEVQTAPESVGMYLWLR